jgi:beta-glucosidase
MLHSIWIRLSYTTFSFDKLKCSVSGNNIVATCIVKNTGKVEGTEIAQLYIGYSQSKVDRPVKTLKGFERVSLLPGEEKTVSITCPIEELGYFNEQLNKMVTENMEYEIYVGSSSAKEDLLKDKLTIKES